MSARFWAKVAVARPDECWEWTGPGDNCGDCDCWPCVPLADVHEPESVFL